MAQSQNYLLILVTTFYRRWGLHRHWSRSWASLQENFTQLLLYREQVPGLPCQCLKPASSTLTVASDQLTLRTSRSVVKLTEPSLASCPTHKLQLTKRCFGSSLFGGITFSTSEHLSKRALMYNSLAIYTSPIYLDCEGFAFRIFVWLSYAQIP